MTKLQVVSKNLLFLKTCIKEREAAPDTQTGGEARPVTTPLFPRGRHSQAWRAREGPRVTQRLASDDFLGELESKTLNA